jgi:DNA-binding NtrC family response regulator
MSAKVLVVDDDLVTCEGLSQLLRGAGYEPLTAMTFHDARTVLYEQKPDIAIVDIRLGPYNGLQLIIEAEAGMPAIVVSGFHDTTLEAEARKAGAEYMIKPVDPARLLEMVERKLKDVKTK